MEFDGNLDFLDDGVDVIGEIDWDFVFEDANGLDSLQELDNAAVTAAPGASPSSSSSSTVEDAPANAETGSTDTWIGEVENMLIKDDDGSKVASEEPPKEYYDNFLADMLVDSPSTESPTDVDSNSNGSAESEKDKRGGSPINNDTYADADADDPVSKKRRRQLRNKDAAMRSRERRKMYVTDLEMKSKYLEGECRRLGRLLQCCYAENHALRLSLQMGNAYGRGVSGTKQESAVLVMELLLLGSLLWFLDLTCLFTLPLMPHLLLLTLNQEQANKALLGVGPRARGGASKMILALQSQSFVKTRRCKASRTKMKYAFLVS